MTPQVQHLPTLLYLFYPYGIIVTQSIASLVPSLCIFNDQLLLLILLLPTQAASTSLLTCTNVFLQSPLRIPLAHRDDGFHGIGRRYALYVDFFVCARTLQTLGIT
jgi:hypothetical protein